MRAYFPLPPTLSINGDKNKILGLLLFKYSNNRLKPIFRQKI